MYDDQTNAPPVPPPPPPPLWNMIPAQIREPLDALFVAIENYERKVGILKDAGLMD